jgi:hypothetical protein
MKKTAAFLLLCFTFINAMATDEYVCEFGSEVTISNNDSAHPKAKLIRGTSKFTFFVEKNEPKGIYINLEFGSTRPIIVDMNESRATFIEVNTSDNLFIVTVFMNKNSSIRKPAVWTQHNYTSKAKDLEFFVPKMALGNCYVTSNKKIN